MAQQFGATPLSRRLAEHRMTFSLYELDDKRRAAMTSLASNGESWSVPEFAIPLVSMNDTSFKQTLVV
ncbi:hypothetical protein RhiTH_003947 [Rhizoctonia solani]